MPLDEQTRQRLEDRIELETEEARIWKVAEHLLQLIARRYRGDSVTIAKEDLEAAGAFYVAEPGEEFPCDDEILHLHQALGKAYAADSILHHVRLEDHAAAEALGTGVEDGGLAGS